MTTHDLRTIEYRFVRQPKPDGIVSIVEIAGWHPILENDFVLISSRYHVRAIDMMQGFMRLRCVHAPRTLSESTPAIAPNNIDHSRASDSDQPANNIAIVDPPQSNGDEASCFQDEGRHLNRRTQIRRTM